MPETETSNYSEKIEQQFDPELIKENIEILNTINESFSTKLSPFYLDSEHQIVAYAHRMRPKDYDRIYTIPTDADYIVFPHMVRLSLGSLTQQTLKFLIVEETMTLHI